MCAVKRAPDSLRPRAGRRRSTTLRHEAAQLIPPASSSEPFAMTSQALPAGTTLLLRGGRVLTPDADWHDPPQADVAVAGDRIAGVAPGYQLAEAGGVAGVGARGQLALSLRVLPHAPSHAP